MRPRPQTLRLNGWNSRTKERLFCADFFSGLGNFAGLLGLLFSFVLLFELVLAAFAFHTNHFNLFFGPIHRIPLGCYIAIEPNLDDGPGHRNDWTRPA